MSAAKSRESKSLQFQVKQSGETRIMIIGQNFQNTSSLIQELDWRKIPVLRASDTAEAIKMLKNDHVQLIFIQVYYNSKAVLGDIREICKYASKMGAPVMMSAAVTSEQELADVIRAGVSDFVLSPVEPKLLVKRMEYQLSKRSVIEVDELSTEVLVGSLELVSDVMKILTGFPDLQRSQFEALRMIATFLKSPRVNIVEGEPYTDRARVLASSDNPDMTAFETSLSKYPEISEVLIKGSIVFVEDISNHSLTRDIQKNVKTIQIESLLVIPLRFRGKTLAALSIKLRKKDAKLAEKHLGAIYSVANALALHMKLKA